MLEQLSRGAPARSPTERRDDNRCSNAFEGGVEQVWIVLERGTCGRGLSAGPATGEAVSAQQHEREITGCPGLGIGVQHERPDAGAVGAENATGHQSARATDADEDER